MTTRLLALLCIALTLRAQQFNRLDIIPRADARETGDVRLRDKNGKRYAGFASAETVNSGGEVVYRLPAGPGGDGQVWAAQGPRDSKGYQQLGWTPNGGSQNIAISAPNPMYLYAHFTDDDKKHLYFSYSIGDGVNWRTVKKDGSLATLENRDPSIVYYGGKFLIITSPSEADPAKIPFYSTTDLRNFDGPYYLDIATIHSGANGAWAPEWFVRPTGELGFYVAVTTTFGPPFTHYFMDFDPDTHTITDHHTFTISGGTGNYFDFYVVYDEATSTYYNFYVDEAIETGVGFWQQIAYATSSSYLGPFTQQTPATSSTSDDFFGFSKTSEAPSVLKRPDGCYRIYADTFQFLFNSTGNGPRKYTTQFIDSCSSTPFASWGGSGATATSSIDGNGRVTSINITAGGSNYTVPPYAFFSGGGTPVDPAKARVYPRDGAVVSSNITATGWGYSSAPTVTIASGPRPINIGASEHGTIIAITDPAIANVVFNAEAQAQNRNGEMGRVVVGDTSIPSYYTLTLRAKGAKDWLMYNESPTIAAEGPDGQAATLSGCGLDQYSCPPPIAGAGRWISAYSGTGGNQIQMNNVATDTGETSILMGNGIAAYGNIPITGSSVGHKALWSFGTNNQYFGPEPDGGNVANNHFFLYNRGLGPLVGGSSVTVANADFEANSSWTDSGCTHEYTTAQAHGGTHSYALPQASDCAVYQDITGLTPGQSYAVSVWFRASSDYLGVGAYLRVHDGTQHNVAFAPIVIPPSDGWQQVFVNYTANSTAAIRIVLRRPGAATESGKIYVDDVALHSGDAIGAFAVGVSPHDGTLYAGYGLRLGEGDSTALSGAYRANIDTFGPGFISIGDGSAPGARNAFIQTGSLQLADYLFLSGPRSAALTINNIVPGSGESSIILGRGLQQSQLGSTGPSSTFGTAAVWKVGMNNACYGLTPDCGNNDNNWFFIYNGHIDNGSDPDGGFPFSISPDSGVVKLNYGMSIGRAAAQANDGTTSVVFTSPLDNVLHIGDQYSAGSHNAIVKAGIFDAGAVFRLDGTDVAYDVGGVKVWVGGVSSPYGVGGDSFWLGSTKVAETSGGIPVWTGGVSSGYGIGATGAYYINGTIGVGGSIACTYTTIQYQNWANANVSLNVCTGLTTNSFTGGIRVN